MRGLWPDVVSVVGPSLTVEFLTLRYAVVCNVESLYLFISFLYLDLYVLGDDILLS